MCTADGQHVDGAMRCTSNQRWSQGQVTLTDTCRETERHYEPIVRSIDAEEDEEHRAVRMANELPVIATVALIHGLEVSGALWPSSSYASNHKSATREDNICYSAVRRYLSAKRRAAKQPAGGGTGTTKTLLDDEEVAETIRRHRAALSRVQRQKSTQSRKGYLSELMNCAAAISCMPKHECPWGPGTVLEFLNDDSSQTQQLCIQSIYTSASGHLLFKLDNGTIKDFKHNPQAAREVRRGGRRSRSLSLPTTGERW